jgi:hypothetical protein
MAKSDTSPIPFEAHWSDSLIRWIQSLPLPGWLFYLFLYFSSALIFSILAWLEGESSFGQVRLIYFLAGFWLVGYLLANQFLILSASAALREFRASYFFSEEAYLQRQFEIMHIPRGPGNVWALVGALIGGSVGLYAITNISSPYDLPVSGMVIFGFFGSPFFTLALYRVYHQMKIVVGLFASIESIDLYDLGSIYALALFPVRVAILILLTFWVNPFLILFPGTVADPVLRFVYTILSLSAVIVIIPIRSVSGRIRDEKEAQLRENGRELTFAREELYRQLHKEGSREIDELEKGVQALFEFRKSIQGVSTLPWKPETIRWLVTVFLLPTLLMIIQLLLQRFYGG